MQVVLGVTGGIAAYKAAELLRLLQEGGLSVQVVMTRNACKFVTPLTFAALSGRGVITEMFHGRGREASGESTIQHIVLAREVEAVVIAPATANILAKLAHGIADDFLTTLCLATKAPLIVAPAMNVEMWQNPATQENLKVLRTRGVQVIDPEEGYLACGTVAAGRLAAVEVIARSVFDTLGLREDFKGETILVTAGPTQEPLDPVRYLSNRSSGKMGYALAHASQRRGARVILVTGPTHLEPPRAVHLERVRTAEEMAAAVFRHLNQATMLLMAAAVADFRPAESFREKIKKHRGPPLLELVPTCDILSEVSARRRPDQLVVGFAAESENLLENAAAKLRAKQLDLIVANDITRDDAGFEADTNVVTLLFRDGRQKTLEKMSKLDVANRILDEVATLRREGSSASRSGAGAQSDTVY